MIKLVIVLFLSILSLNSIACDVKMGIRDLNDMMVSVENEMGVLTHSDKQEFYTEAKKLLKRNDITDEDMTVETIFSIGMFGGDLFFDTALEKGIFNLFVLETLGEGACSTES